MSKFRLLSARILILSSRAYLLAWETGRRPVVMSDAKVLEHVICEHRPAGSDTEFERGPGRTSFLPDFPCFAENQQKAARSSTGRNE